MSTVSEAVRAEIAKVFASEGITPHSVEVRAYADESNYIVYVHESDLTKSIEISISLDAWIEAQGWRGFVVVRKAAIQDNGQSNPLTSGVADPRANELVQLISARSRVSESQPSLYYVRDSTASVASITSPRHHLIFGRRGAGKSALLSEGKRIAEGGGDLTVWYNVQTVRREEPRRVFLYVADEVVNRVLSALEDVRASSAVTVLAVEASAEIRRLLALDDLPVAQTNRVIPQVQRVLRRSLEVLGRRLYVFVDDFYYVPRSDQPMVLDMLHGCVRDCDAWLKIASIRHLSRWFEASPPTGLQTGQDADILDLDVTLQDPGKAKEFLESVLSHYADQASVPRLTSLFSGAALDRLILAAGAVPRDYLVLCSAAVRKAQSRPGARLVGVQDVNQAAGDAAQVKIQELEDDLASNQGTADRTLAALQRLRTFCLEETETTYFRVDFKDKEGSPKAYNVLADLLDVRLMHLLDASISDAHAAGERSEAFVLDLSQFSGSRLKQGIRVVDFRDGRLVSHKTRVKDDKIRVGTTARQVLTILRAAPVLNLSRFQDLVDP